MAVLVLGEALLQSFGEEIHAGAGEEGVEGVFMLQCSE